MKKAVCVALLLILAAACVVIAEDCNGAPNMHPIIRTPPKLVNTIKNGKLFVYDQLDPPLHVVHVYGTAYEMGYARGMLMKEPLEQLMPEVFEYMEAQANPFLQDLPAEVREFIETYGVEAALDLTELLTGDYTPPRFLDELRGLGDAVPKVGYNKFYQVAMLPELIKAACSMFGVWGKAIENTNGTLYQLRALDWNTSGPFQKYPTVTVYHPNKGDGHAFASVQWIGLVGSITGFSEAPLGLCEKVWLSYAKESTRIGKPWTFVLRDILQYAVDVTSGLDFIYNASRTCSIFVGLGDPVHKFDAVKYSYEEVIVYDQFNFPVYQGHPKMKDVVYIDKHVQPSHDPCLGSLMEKYYGNITPEVTLRNITAVFGTGDMHIAIYDFAEMRMYVSNAGVYDPKTKYAQPAYQRQFVSLDMNAVFAEPRPMVTQKYVNA